MDHGLFAKLRRKAPKFNKAITNGFASDQLRHAAQYVNAGAMNSLSGTNLEGFEVLGLRPMTPLEEYRTITAKRNGRNTFELGRSDVRLYSLVVRYLGTEIHKPLYIPFSEGNNLLYLRDKLFMISPVLADKTISVGMESIYVSLGLAKLNLFRSIQHFYRDGQRETVYVVWSDIYNDRKSKGLTEVRGKTSLILYLFCKYGVSQTFSDRAGCPIIFGDIDEIHSKLPDANWTVCQSTGFKPKEVMRRDYTPSRLAIAVPTHLYNPLVASLIGGLFHIADMFPEETVPTPEFLDNVNMWRCLLGRLVIAEYNTEGILLERINKHFMSLDTYLDDEHRERFMDDNIYCKDIYDFLAWTVENFNQRIMDYRSQAGSLYGKRLTVLRYVLFDIMSEINRIKFSLQPDGKRTLSVKDVETRMNRLDRDTILKINNPNHGEVTSVSVSGDNNVFKITTHIVMQTSSSGSRRGRTNISDPSQLLDVSLAEVCCYNSTSKSDPSSRNRLNPFVQTDATGQIVRDESIRELTDRTQLLIKMR